MKTDLVKILIVDDSHENLQVILNSLFNGGYLNILCTKSGTDALRIAEDELPNIIILDWDMPVMNGIMVLKKLKDNPITTSIPVIIATGAMLSSNDLAEALANGAIDYIRKPFDEIELLARVKSGLEFSEMLQTIQKQKVKIEQQNYTLGENEKRITALLNASNEAIVFIENDLIIETSQHFCIYTGFTKDEIIGKSFFYFFPREFRNTIVDIENLVGTCIPVTLINKNHENILLEMVIKQSQYNHKKVLAASFININQYGHLLNDEQNNIFINREAIIHPLSDEIQKLKNDKQELLGELQVKTLQSACCYNFMVNLSKNLNEILASIPDNMPRLRDEILKCSGKLKNQMNDKVWDEFKLRFADVHTGFYDKLISHYPTLTENDLRLCAFIKLKMTTKEIATLINQPVNSVKVARNRLRNKLRIEDASESLLTFLVDY